MKYICLVGSGATRDDTPFEDRDAIIYSTVSVSADLPRVDVALDVHPGEYTAEHLNSLPVKEFLFNFAIDGVHDANLYPMQEMEAKYGKVFPGSMSMLLAHAAEKGLPIYLYGVDLSADSEYGVQRPLFLYLLGLLRGRGVKIEISPGSALNDECQTYCYDEPTDKATRKYKKKAQDTLSADKHELERLKERIAYAEGFLEAIDIQGRSKKWR